jgi:hypothetical protein
MAFLVHRNDGATNDSEFEAYARLLRQRGVDLGNLPRAPEPGAGRRWLYAWDSREQAQAFADELKHRTRDDAWEVVQVDTPPSQGPMGPIIIQVGRPLSRATIQSAFPGAKGSATTVSLNFDVGDDLRNLPGRLHDLAREFVPTLRGLKLPELEQLGYAMIEDDTDRTLVFVRPHDLVQA